VELHQAAGRLFALVPQNPAELHGDVHNVAQVLAEEPEMRRAFIALILAGVALAVSRRVPTTLVCVLVLAITSFVWFQVNHAREGVILLSFSPSHGLTEADLLVPVVVMVAGGLWLLGQLWRRRRRAQEPATPIRIPSPTS